MKRCIFIAETPTFQACYQNYTQNSLKAERIMVQHFLRNSYISQYLHWGSCSNATLFKKKKHLYMSKHLSWLYLFKILNNI